MSELIRWVARRIEESDLDDDTGLVVLAALDGAEALTAHLAGDGSVSTVADVAAAPVDVRPVYLTGIDVEGFRGVGRSVRLDLQPGPGLTIVMGRNGSGKSSLAEAFELALTGDTFRWSGRNATWREQWRNLHHPAPTRIAVDFLEDGGTSLRLAVEWHDDATDVDERTTSAQRHGEKRLESVAALGWTGPLERFRPILSYNELGGLLDGRPSELYDALARVLGVGGLADALGRLKVHSGELKRPEAELRKRRADLRARAAGHDDERAKNAARQLGKTTPDLDALRATVTGTSAGDDGLLGRLRALSTLRMPCDDDAPATFATRLRGAVADVADGARSVSRRESARLDLLERALVVHREHGDMSCPVCGQGSLDAGWQTELSREAATRRAEYAALHQAEQTLSLAISQSRSLLSGCPQVLRSAPMPELDAVLRRARDTWDAWARPPLPTDSALAVTAARLADHLEEAGRELAAALVVVREAAGDALRARDDAWRPVAADIAAWCGDYAEWRREKPRLDRLLQAEKWLKDNDLRLKNEKLAPIADRARAAWSKLRQESNVEIGDLELAGANTSRRVVIGSTVDGEEAGGLAILSQGELHALALSLFLPGATLDESPFRFVVLDDPVQAMDPAKVDGLVDLLAEVAKTRQVIVLSHDDRLGAAVRRRHDLSARVVEVSRQEASEVSVAVASDPATRYLRDARALLKDTSVTDAVRRRVLPGLLRMAVETSAHDRYFATRLGAGKSLDNVESAWSHHHGTRDRVSLAIYGDVRSLDGWLRRGYRSTGLGVVTSGMHSGLHANKPPLNAVEDVERLVDDLREGAR